MRYTKTREDVYNFLTKHPNKAFTPYEVAESLQMNHVTVYRVLEFLQTNKLVHHIPSLGKWSACQCHGKTEDHGFLICRKCENVEEFLTPHRCVHQSNFRCEEHITEVLGTCQHCL